MKFSAHDLLLRSLDAELTADEQKQLDAALAESEELRREAEQLDLLRQNVTNSTPQSFSPFFAEKVLSQIRTEKSLKNEAESFFDALFASFRPVALAAAVIIFVLLSFNAFQNNGRVWAGVLTGESVGVELAFDPASDWIGE